MSRQTKTPSFLRDSAIFETTVQFPVNPYVTGSSPVARAKIDTPLFQAFEQRAFLLLLLHFFHQLNSSRSTVLLFAVFEKTSNFLLKNSRNLRFLSSWPNYNKMY